jgi:peptidoglycan-associated lipoprotein
MRRGVRVVAAVMLAAAVGVSACAKKKDVPPPVTPTATTETPRPTTPPPPPAPAAPPRETPPRVPTEDEIFARKTLPELSNELSPAFFALDSAQLADDARPVLQKNADWMKRWTSTKVMVEGHADSRGTAEYNLALGERRASAVRDYLVSLGIGADRITIVSKGKESPFCTEETESCWQQNRRGHFVVTAK